MPVQIVFCISWVVAGLAIVFLFWALAWDWVRHLRKRPRRCPKCWYDLSHTPGLTCSECGYTARCEKKLSKSRKRWRYVVLSVFLIVGVVALQAVRDDVRQRGWVAAVPTSVIIAGLPFLEDADYQRMMMTSAVAEPSLSVRLYTELVSNRLRPGEMWEWQERWLLRKCISGDRRRPPASDAWFFMYARILQTLRSTFPLKHLDLINEARDIYRFDLTYPDIWIRGKPVYVTGDIKTWDPGGGWRAVFEEQSGATASGDAIVPRTPELWWGPSSTFDARPWIFPSQRIAVMNPTSGTVDAYEFTVHLEFREDEFTPWERIDTWSEPIHVDLVDSIDEIMEPVEIPQFAEGLKVMPTAEVQRYTDLWTVELNLNNVGVSLEDFPIAQEKLDKFAFGFRIELMQQNQVIATGFLHADAVVQAGKVFPESEWARTVLEFQVDQSLLSVLEGSAYRMRIAGDPETALRGIDANYYWSGEALVPVGVSEALEFELLPNRSGGGN